MSARTTRTSASASAAASSTGAPLPARRRTQRERRETTVAKLLQATIDTVADVGYARTSTKEVCSRAGISQGGLFRHFATREDLVVAAAQEVARRQLANMRARLAEVASGSDQHLEAAIRLVRQATRTPINAVFHELLVAARTDERLADKLRPAVLSYYLEIYALATEQFGIEADPDRSFEAVLFGVLMMFDGETIGRVIHVDPEIEERRIQWIVKMAGGVLDELRSGRPQAGPGPRP